MVSRIARFCAVTALCVGLSLPAGAGWAQEKSEDKAQKTDDVVVVSSPIIEGDQVNRLASEVTVISEQQIDDMNAGDLPSALRRTPGVVISRHNPVGSFGGGSGGAVFIRGMGSGRPGQDIVTMIDGIPMVVGVWNHSVMDMLSIDNVHAIEVYKGAQPVLFGNNAFAAINILPKYKKEDGFYTHGKLAGGSYNSLTEMVETGGKIEGFDYYLVQSYRYGDGQRDNAGGSLQNYYGNIGYSFNPHLRLSLLVNYTNNWSEDPGPEGHPEESDGTFKTRDTISILKLEDKYDWGYGYVKAYWDDGHLDWQDQSDGSDTRTDYNNYGIRINQTLTMWQGGALTLGFDQDYLSGKVLNISASGTQKGGEKETFRLSQPYAAISQEFKLGEVSFIPSLGARYFDHNNFSSETGYQAGAIVRYQDSELHANFAHTYNYPGVYVVQQSKLYWNNSLWENLKPEELNHFELGVSQKFASWVKADLTYFRDKGSDRLVLVYNPTHWENIGDFDNQGIEGNITFYPTRNLALFVGGTYLDRSPEDTPYAPEWSGSAGANWRFLPGWMASVDAQYVDEYYVSDTRYAGTRKMVDGFLVFNAKVSYAFKMMGLDMKVFAAGENLTNQDYEYKPGYPMPGINGMLGVEFSF
ncbi:MAG: TonB-dependent receptor plug domain-containing protein [Proteobacteria bacterium]|nr:TonB-dependent receptor plug domain-containing protein [Pseudomonadota bacterium]MBU4382838.1 TonB-dependent receptor plug domain-containing protein [Pseudomonadota bacterium]MBU4606677.1 TonB-dependent receptor plug domain-containing protein [Pseudomonadota bacterium]MCG2765353.1 TonB-dependent receptor plug domain-containing protein [Desulfarculaceae bacterium]